MMSGEKTFWTVDEVAAMLGKARNTITWELKKLGVPKIAGVYLPDAETIERIRPIGRGRGKR